MAMDSLTEWYRYIDQVSRPARKASEEDDEPEPWRPWNAVEAVPPVEAAISADAIPDLSTALGLPGLAEARHPATTEYIDPTVHDQLAPIPAFSAPSLSPPAFEITIPRLGEQTAVAEKVPEPTPPVPAQPTPNSSALHAAAEVPVGLTLPERSHSPSEEQVDAEDEPASAALSARDARLEELSDGEMDETGARGQGVRHWDLLCQIRSHDVAQNSYKSTFRETREELVQRLLDPPLTLEETARLLGVCPTTVRRYTNKGQLRHFRTTGNQRRFRLSDVLEFLESRATEIEADAQADRAAGLEN
jgi:excisionase family DNA binding protein